ncbi:MAG: hypothetical protein COB30_017900 [Ectothiorhodospiraceae bacterium]|nr:hypothetical protein [Ectothiorhodospiraceae bacterium]
MVGKKNVIFGFLFLATTAALGPLMVVKYDDWGVANTEKQLVVGQLQALKAGDYEEDPETLDDLSAKQLAVANAEAILAMNKVGANEFEIDFIKGGPHAHGNLESLLNIVVGIALCFIAAPLRLKQAVSLMFIVGTLMHSGLLYLERVFMLPWASTLLNTGIGPVLILLGLVLMGGMAVKGFRGEVVKE